MSSLSMRFLHFYLAAPAGLEDMPTLQRYGSTDRIHFKIIDSNGSAVTSAVFQANDIMLSLDDSTSWVSIASSVSEKGKGSYFWTPASAGLCQCKEGVIALVDVSGGVFVENEIIFHTYGDANSRYPEFS